LNQWGYFENSPNSNAQAELRKKRTVRLALRWTKSYRGGKTKTLQIYKAGDYFEKKLENNP
jgi:hypothetical protein